MHVIEFSTLLGPTIVAGDERGLAGVWFNDQRHFAGIQDTWIHQETELLRSAKHQLLSYFAGELQQFELPLAPQGTLFQERVWQALQGIDYGATCSYGDIAHQLNQPKAVRAVGAGREKSFEHYYSLPSGAGQSEAINGVCGGVGEKELVVAVGAGYEIEGWGVCT